ncbi:ImuA family protein [Pelagibius sp. Alg239-R121]|uniref:ImuA family protein n=1 Tax=Pelagibius sp. Alg239-R121 TaxID=2993448 RepID=UPI0024A7637A|nr:hypothetical protein [Pelagibius sp. Alg239-R121]
MFRSKYLRKTPDAPPAGETVARLAALREELRKIEQSDWNRKTGETIELGLPEIDNLLSGEDFSQDRETLQSKEAVFGLRRGCLHELSGEGAEAFAAILSGRLKGPVLWCADALAGSDLYPPGLTAFGLDHRRLIIVRCHKPRETLSAMEDGLRCRALAAVVGELSARIDLTASRRLQLAAEGSGVTGFLVKSAWRDQISKSQPISRATGKRKAGGIAEETGTEWGQKAGETERFSAATQEKDPSAAFSRWSVGAARNGSGASGALVGGMTWRLSLLRCRNGGSGAWTVKWDAKTYRFSLAAETADGQVDPSSGQRLVG